MKNYFTLPNSLFSAELTANEFAVLSYLISIYTNIKSSTGHRYVRVRQKTIAKACGLRTTQTVARITASLMKKGYLSHILAAYRVNSFKGTYTYVINNKKLSGKYAQIDRAVFSYGLQAKQLKVYMYIVKCIDSKLGYCWQSANDIAKALQMKRCEVIKIVSQLVLMRKIRKMRKLRYDNAKVYSDNAYSLRVVRLIKKQRIKELQPSYEQDCNKTIFSALINKAYNFVKKYYNNTYYNNTVEPICQVVLLKKFKSFHNGAAGLLAAPIFLKKGGSPQNRRS